MAVLKLRRNAEEALSPTEDMLEFIHNSPTMFHAAATICERLEQEGFEYVPEQAQWDIQPGGAYYTQRNGSSVVAWRVGAEVARGDRSASAVGEAEANDAEEWPYDARPAAGARAGAADAPRARETAPYHFQMTASHSDSPCFKVKSSAEVEGPAEYLRLNTEAYGGMMDYTWFDRPLSLAGRVLVREGSRIESRLVSLNRDVALIPSLAIHMNHDVNKAFSPNRASDLYPLVSCGDLAAGSFDQLIADALEVEPSQLVARDLFLVNREKGRVWGATDEFVSSPRLDDLMCAYTSLAAFVQARNERAINVYACFDNEEVGSETKQGAASTLLADTLSRVNTALGYAPDDLVRALSASMLVSCDNAHAQHPAHHELADALNAPQLNLGIAVKEAANQHYCTDAFSRAAFEAILDDAQVPYQGYANRSDMAGGSTLGNISNMQVSVHAVDVGCAQLAMHSCVETAGARDVELAIDAIAAFYSTDIRISGAEAIEFAR
ncbi:MAG: M18 family aminopeptidase [Coriobacteriaceae bacterium]|nr:M18 family aminopeptidase [Coriobacteriaceae bacterium]